MYKLECVLNLEIVEALPYTSPLTCELVANGMQKINGIVLVFIKKDNKWIYVNNK